MALITVLAAAAVTLTGCSGIGGSTSIDHVEVKGTKAKPTLKVKKGFSTKTTKIQVLKKGSGTAVAKGDTVQTDFVAADGRTGKQIFSSFSTKTPQWITLSSAQLGGLLKALVGQKPGAQVLAAMSAKDAAKSMSSTSTLGIKKTDTLVFLFHVRETMAKKASGTTMKLPANVPQVTYSSKGVPVGFKKTATSPTTVSKAAAYVAVEGKGEKLKSGETLWAQYVGATLKNLKVFQTSWSSSAFSAAIGSGQVITCWDKLLVGQRIGSRVVLMCPASTAYGNKKSTTGSPTGDLIFTVDLLAKSAS